MLIIAFLFGSFTNVLIYRIPREESLLRPRSHCPECKYQLKWYENIPVLSYIFLKAKCSNCHTHIPARYLIVEIIVGLLGACFIDKIHHLAEYLFIMIVISAVVAMAFIDHKHHKLPHVLSYSSIIIAFVYIGFCGSPYYKPLQAFLILLNANYIWWFIGVPLEVIKNFSILLISLANLFSALSFFGISIFSLDCFTHMMNLVYFRAKALKITPVALCFKNDFLTKHITYLYLALVLVEILLVYNSPIYGFFWFNLLIGLSYFINEIVFEYLLNRNLSEARAVEEEQGSTVFGGGDTVLVSLIAIILGPVNALVVLLTAFYIALIYYVILKISSIFDKKTQAKSSKYIPLGGALAIAFIAAMIIL